MQKFHINIAFSAPPPWNSGGRSTSDINVSYANIQDYLSLATTKITKKSQTIAKKHCIINVLLF